MRDSEGAGPEAGAEAGASPFDTDGLVRYPDGRLWYRDHPETFTALLYRTVRRHGDSEAVVDVDGASITYADLWERAAAVAGGLREAGVDVGDRVAIDLPNSLAWVTGFLGAVLAGAAAVPLDQRGSAQSRQATLTDAAPKVVLDDPDGLPSASPFVHEPAPSDLGQMLYTSGTTGEPKGVMVLQRNLAALSEITRRVFRLGSPGSPPLRNLVAIPLCHAAGCNAQLLPTLALGGTALLTRSSRPNDIVTVAEKHEPTMMLAVPAVYKLVVQREAERFRRLSSLRWLTYGAAPVSTGLIDELRALLPDVRLGNAFGMTEISNMALFLPHEFAVTHHESIGFPVPGVEVELRDQDDSGQGQMFLRGPNMAAGYWGKPAMTEETFGTGWVRSGDIATIGEHGLVHLKDRAKDIINRGGEKIYSLQVENALVSHPAVDEAAVLPVRDEVMGEKVGGVVVSSNASLTRADLLAYLGARLPPYALPEHLVIRAAALPRGSSGKILKVQLRGDLGWE
jgi:acyl-CoA synthetase (AMP-forming)/AMP-acid ligase II